MGNGRSKSGLSSDAGSDHTDQSLLVRIVFISLYNVRSKYPQMTSKKSVSDHTDQSLLVRIIFV